MSDFNNQYKFFEIAYTINKKGREKFYEEVVIISDLSSFEESKK
jgi:hypothetical protein